LPSPRGGEAGLQPSDRVVSGAAEPVVAVEAGGGRGDVVESNEWLKCWPTVDENERAVMVCGQLAESNGGWLCWPVIRSDRTEPTSAARSPSKLNKRFRSPARPAPPLPAGSRLSARASVPSRQAPTRNHIQRRGLHKRRNKKKRDMQVRPKLNASSHAAPPQHSPLPAPPPASAPTADPGLSHLPPRVPALRGRGQTLTRSGPRAPHPTLPFGARLSRLGKVGSN